MLEIFPYSRSGREGALLRIRFQEGFGYADLHPWPLFGEPSLKEQLKALPSSLIEGAYLDAKARAQGRSLFEGLSIPKSHALVFSKEEMVKAKEEGFSCVKWKIRPGDAVAEGLHFCYALGLNVRLDANLSYTEESFLLLLREQAPWQIVEFVEDPFPGSNRWYQLFLKTACDWEGGEGGEFSIIKPYRKAPSLNRIPIITGHLGHPLGDLFAAYLAAKQGQGKDLHGLLGYRTAPFTSFTERLSQRGPSFTPPAGTGLGFDDLLEKLPWQPIQAPAMIAEYEV